jgi:hypothetical protein
VGQQTWETLLNFPVTLKTPKAIQAIQISLGLPPTGIWDPAFVLSVKNFQAARGIPSTGVVDLGTWHLLVSGCNSSLATAVWGFDIGWPEGKGRGRRRGRGGREEKGRRDVKGGR